MPSDERPVFRADRDVRSDSEFLRGQLAQWMEAVEGSGRTADLFELEMWLRSFERFFRIKNQPLSDRELKQLALRNWAEELRLVDNVVVRAMTLCSNLLSEDQLNHTRFDKYVEGYLRRDDVVDPYVERLLRQSTPEAEIGLLRESFEDLHVLLANLTRLPKVSYASFTGVGRLLYREVRRSQLLSLLIDKKFKPIHDRIENAAIARLIRALPDAGLRKQTAKIFLELFRLLHYLEYADPERRPDEDLRNAILIFALITSETRLLTAYLERRVLRNLEPGTPLYDLCDSFVYCLPLELKKVINTELLDISAARQPDSIRARVENSHGILRDSFQQSIVQLAQQLDPDIDGSTIFPDFTAKLSQSLWVRDGLARLIERVRDFQQRRDEPASQTMKEAISAFYDDQMKYLMYRDWSGFELFFIEILKCGSLPGLLQIAHRFETFLTTLYREVQKRAVLQGAEPAPDALHAGA
jgi:hypothetical protein